MPFNLLSDPFLPVVTAKGNRRLVRFADLFDPGDDPPVDFDWPRPDLNIAAHEFCIGVLSVAAQPNEDVWRQVWDKPPLPDELDNYLDPIRPAFNLDGDGPRFMQAFEDIGAGDPNPVEALFIDTPGANAQKKNTDLLTHRDRVARLGLPAAAMALYAMQQFAPSGGAGNRTSMRGGGPMTTLAIVRADNAPVPLWRRLWLNVPQAQGRHLDDPCVPEVFPWLAPTITSDKASGERTISQEDKVAHPLQACFGMPRRIRLVLDDQPGRCGLLADVGPVVSGFIQVPWGVNYGVWEHPLTPYRQQKEDSEPYSTKPKGGRFGYRDWVSVTAGDADQRLARPSRNISALQGRLAQLGTMKTGLLVAGWAMNNMEAIAYLHAEQPLYLARDAGQQAVLDSLARAMAKAGDVTHDILRMAIRRAYFSDGAKPDTSSGLFNDLRHAFYADTDDAFHAILADATQGDSIDHKAALDAWYRVMRRNAVRLFEANAPDPTTSPQHAERMAKAYSGLNLSLAGYGPSGKLLFAALERPVPVTKKKKEKADA